jgi:hypothetical protein
LFTRGKQVEKIKKANCQQGDTTITIATDVQQTVQSMQKSQTVGDLCIVTTKKTIEGRLNDRGTVCLLVGYPDNHANDVYMICNNKTKQITKS